MKWSIEIIEDWTTIWSDSFQKEWLEILDKSPNGHVFFHPALVKAWVETYLPLRKLKPIFVVAEQKEVKALFPLVLWSQNWKNAFRKMIVPMGYSDFDYHDPVFSEEVSPDDISSFYSELLLSLPSYDEIIIDGLHDRYISNEFEIADQTQCPFIDINQYDSYDGYVKSLKRSFVREYERTSRRMIEKYGQLTKEIYSGNNTEKALNELDALLYHHSQRWPLAYKAPGFHEKLLKSGLKVGVLDLIVNKTIDGPFSWLLVFKFKGVHSFYMIAVDYKYHPFSPGKFIYFYAIDHAFSEQMAKIDYLRGDELYKSEWTNDSNLIYTIRLQNTSFLSRIKSVLIFLKRRMQK